MPTRRPPRNPNWWRKPRVCSSRSPESSLDEEAIRLVQLQSSYDAASKVVTVIDDTLQTLMTMIPT